MVSMQTALYREVKPRGLVDR